MRVETVISAVLGAATLVIAVVLVRREFFPARPTAPVVAAPEFVESWNEWRPFGRTIGNSSARVTIVEFADLECPFCRSLDQSLSRLQARHPQDVALLFVHYPLPQHRFAKPAARALECSAPEGRFGGLMHLVYEKQDSLGLKSWTSFAEQAGVRNVTEFERCLSTGAVEGAIDSGRALGARVKVTFTPTVIVNGWRFGAPPSDSLLTATAEEILATGKPSFAKAGR